MVLFKTLFNTFKPTTGGQERALLAALIASFAGFLVHSLLEVPYYDCNILLPFWLLAGMAGVLARLSMTTALGNGSAVETLPAA